MKGALLVGFGGATGFATSTGVEGVKTGGGGADFSNIQGLTAPFVSPGATAIATSPALDPSAPCERLGSCPIRAGGSTP